MKMAPSFLLSMALLVSAVALAAGQPAAPYKTPEEVFDAAKAAVKKGDFKTFVLCLTPDNAAQVADGMAGLCAFLMAFAEKLPDEAKTQMKGMLDVAAKYGLTAEALKNLDLKGSKEEQEKAIKTLTAKIKSKADFIADFFGAMPEKDRAALKEEVASSTLKNLKVDGDKASATIVSQKAGQAKEQPVEFRRIEGSWRMIMEMKK